MNIFFFFFFLHAEIQDGHQKRQENDFWEQSPVDTADTLWVKNFVEIAPSRTVSDSWALSFSVQLFFHMYKSNHSPVL